MLAQAASHATTAAAMARGLTARSALSSSNCRRPLVSVPVPCSPPLSICKAWTWLSCHDICSKSASVHDEAEDISGESSASKLDLRSQLHHAVRRQPEKARGALGVAHHRGEDLLPPHRHAAGPRRDDQRLAA